MATVNFPSNPALNDVYTNASRSWIWNGRFWQATSTTVGYTGSRGTDGTLGYSGSKGESSFTFDSIAPGNPIVGDRWYDIVDGAELVWVTDADGSQWVEVAASGYAGQTGYTGSSGPGYTGSRGAGFTGSVGYVGSSSTVAGYTGSAGVGYTGSIGLVSRSTATVTTASVANAASTTASITGFRGYNLYKVYSSHAAWVRFYTNVAARTTDSSRTQGTDPTPDIGIITEVITSGAGQTVTLAPAVLGFNDENPVTTAIPIAVTNLSGSAVAITVTVTLVQTEA